MRLKSFHGATLSEAMAQVREALGDEAIIVATRDEENGVRVTAALEEVDIAPIVPPDDELPMLSAPINFMHQPEDYIEEIVDILYRHGIPAPISEAIISSAMTAPTDGDLQDILTHALATQLKFDLSTTQHSKPILLVGPPGAGKTLTTAKLAARALLAGQRPAVFTTDVMRAGGVEQLQGFTRLMKLELIVCESAASLADGILAVPEADIIIVDNGGYNPYDMDDMQELVGLFKATGGLNAVDAIFVLPAGYDAVDAGELARVYGKLGVKRMIATRLDVSRRLGGTIAAVYHGGMQLLALSDTAHVADGLVPVTAAVLAERLIKGHKKHE